jgi:hypothetical protein
MARGVVLGGDARAAPLDRRGQEREPAAVVGSKLLKGSGELLQKRHAGLAQSLPCQADRR